jgi:hypothetical protein
MQGERGSVHWQQHKGGKLAPWGQREGPRGGSGRRRQQRSGEGKEAARHSRGTELARSQQQQQQQTKKKTKTKTKKKKKKKKPRVANADRQQIIAQNALSHNYTECPSSSPRQKSETLPVQFS